VINLRKIFFILLFALCCVSIIGCNETVKPTLELSKSSVELEVGATYTIEPVIKNLEGTDLVKYSVSDPEVLEISENIITAVKVGNATVTVELKEYSDIKAILSVNVTEPKASEGKVTVTGANEVEVGKTIELSASLESVEGDVVWYSSDASIATVENGVVTGVALGTVKITATVGDVVGELEVTVKAQEHVHNFVDGRCECGEEEKIPSLTINGEKEVIVGENLTLTAVLENIEGTVIWSSSDETVATIADGVVTGVKAGNVTIKAELGELSAEVEIVVKSNGSIKIIGKTMIYVSKTTTLRTTLTNVEGDVVWASSDDTIATVVDGKVTGVAPGTVTIYASIGDVVGSHEIIIEENPAVVVEGETKAVIGTPLQLTAKLINTEGEVIWSSKNEEVATVDANGLVTGLSTGKVVIKAEVGTLYCNYIIDVVNPTFTVTFIGYNGEVLSTQEVEKGEAAVPPTVPQKEGLVFKGWDTKYDNITEDLEIKGIFEKNAYFVTYDLNGGQSEELYIKNGTAVTSFIVDNYNYNNGNYWAPANKYATDIHIGNSNCDPKATFSDRIYIAKDENTGFYTIINIIMSGPSSWPTGAEYVITISSSYSAYRANHTKVQSLQVGDIVVFDKPIASITKQAPGNVYYYREKPTNFVFEASVGKDAKLITPAYLGYEFLGWYDESGKKYESGADLTDDVKLTAKWGALNPVTDLNISSMTTELVTGEEFQIVASVVPSDAYFTEILYYSSDEDIVEVTAEGKMIAGNAGTVKITITDFMGVVVKEYEVTVHMISSIDAKFSDDYKGVLNIGDSVEIIAETVGKDSTGAQYTYKSSNEAVATVDANGKVTATGLGTANITISDNVNSSEDLTVAIVVATMTETDKVEKVMKLLAESNFSTVETGNFGIYNDGTQRYYQANYGSVNRFMFAPFVVNTEYCAKAEAYTGGHKDRRFTGGFDDSIEFVTVHDTATLTGTVVSIASNMSQSGTSIHYTTGNDAIYAVVPEKYIAYHAGDGTGTPFKWYSTGVDGSNIDVMDYTTYPTWDIYSQGGKWYWIINGVKTSNEAPISNGSRTISNPSKENITDLGPAWKVIDGIIYIGTTWVDFSQMAIGAISSHGGNNNSIGIEMCVNVSSDMYDTLQRTAQLVADILIRNNLDLSRVKMHNTWSGKNCPQVLRAGSYWWDFIEMVKLHYIIMKDYADVKIEMKSNNPDIVDETGRVYNAPTTTTSVSYDLTVSCGETSKTMTLYNIVPGTTTWSQWNGTYPSKQIWNNGKFSRLAK